MAIQATSANLARKFLNPKYSDLNVRCANKSFPVHRAVVCSSEPMAIEVDDATIEGTTRVIEHTRFDAEIMDKCFQYWYRDDYTLDPTDSMATIDSDDDVAAMALSTFTVGEDEGLRRLVTHIRVHEAAQHYELPELEQLAVLKFSLELESLEPLSPEHLMSIAGKSVLLGCPLHEPNDFQEEVLAVALKNHKEYLAQPSFLNAMFERLELREFATRFLQEVTDKHEAELVSVAQHSLSTYVKWHGDMESKEAQLQHELTDARTRNDTLQAKQLLHQSTKMLLEQERDYAKAASRSIEAALDSKSQVIDQLLELNRIEKCRSCKRVFYYNHVRRGPNGYLAACVDCRTRHFAGPNNGVI